MHPHAFQCPNVHSVQVMAVVMTKSSPNASPETAFTSSSVRLVGPAGLPGNHSSCSGERLRRYLASFQARTTSRLDIGGGTSCGNLARPSMRLLSDNFFAGSHPATTQDWLSSKKPCTAP